MKIFDKILFFFSKKVIELDPKNVNAYFNRGSCSDMLGHFKEAIQVNNKSYF